MPGAGGWVRRRPGVASERRTWVEWNGPPVTNDDDGSLLPAPGSRRSAGRPSSEAERQCATPAVTEADESDPGLSGGHLLSRSQARTRRVRASATTLLSVTRPSSGSTLIYYQLTKNTVQIPTGELNFTPVDGFGEAIGYINLHMQQCIHGWMNDFIFTAYGSFTHPLLTFIYR